MLGGTSSLGELVLRKSEVPVEQEVFALRVAYDPLPVSPELGVVGREQQQPGQRPLSELLDEVAVTEVGVDPPVRGHRTEVDDAHVATRRLWLLVGLLLGHWREVIR